jgi:hypothetical protein
MSLKDLIPSDQLQLLQRKYPHLDQLHYVCRCETCNLVFFDEPVSKVQEMLKSGDWDPHQAASQLWYIQAAKHWVPQTFHSVRVYVTLRGDRTLVKDLSAEWTAQMPQQKKMIKKGISFEQAMLNELDFLESQIQKRKKKS